MANIHLTLAMDEYDHTRDLLQGKVNAEGIDLTWLNLDVEEIFYRFASAWEWDVSELSFAKYCSIVSQPDPPITGIPVFVSRVFRHSAWYVAADGPVKEVADLAGKRIGIPEWSQTATVYARGWLAEDAGIPLQDVDWVQAGVNEPGRIELAHLKLPDGIRYRQIPDRSLTEMLLAGDIDALTSARPPTAFLGGDPRIERLIPDYRAQEQDYFKRTGVYPIMHTVAIRRDTYQKHPWIAMNLLNGFEAAKKRSVARLTSVTHSQIPVPWIYDMVPELGGDIFPGGDYWPYGIEPNRPTIEAFLRFCYDQGLCHRKLEPEDLYPAEVQSVFRV